MRITLSQISGKFVMKVVVDATGWGSCTMTSLGIKDATILISWDWVLVNAGCGTPGFKFNTNSISNFRDETYPTDFMHFVLITELKPLPAKRIFHSHYHHAKWGLWTFQFLTMKQWGLDSADRFLSYCKTKMAVSQKRVQGYVSTSHRNLSFSFETEWTFYKLKGLQIKSKMRIRLAV
jgi:hypothetical protein